MLVARTRAASGARAASEASDAARLCVRRSTSVCTLSTTTVERVTETARTTSSTVPAAPAATRAGIDRRATRSMVMVSAAAPTMRTMSTVVPGSETVSTITSATTINASAGDPVQVIVSQIKLDDLHYGRPRTAQLDAWVGHNEAAGTPTH